MVCNGFDAKTWGEAWERDLPSEPSDDEIDLDDAACARNLYASSSRTKAPTYALLPVLSRKELRGEPAPRGPRPAWDLPHSRRRGRGPRQALGFIELLSPDGRACAGGNGGQHRRSAWQPRPSNAHRRYPRESDERNVARGATELFQEPAESQGPRCEREWRFENRSGCRRPDVSGNRLGPDIAHAD